LGPPFPSASCFPFFVAITELRLRELGIEVYFGSCFWRLASSRRVAVSGGGLVPLCDVSGGLRPEEMDREKSCLITAALSR
jgi:hypothetical protein